jgi:hypothetical protein
MAVQSDYKIQRHSFVIKNTLAPYSQPYLQFTAWGMMIERGRGQWGSDEGEGKKGERRVCIV